jgi:hypothetical protein
MDNLRYVSLWRKRLVLVVDLTVVGILGYGLWLFLDYWWRHMSSNREVALRDVLISWDALNPVSYAHQSLQAILLFVSLVIVYFSRRGGYVTPRRIRPTGPASSSRPQVPLSSTETHRMNDRHLRRIAGVVSIVGGSLSFLLALLCWIALPLVNSPLTWSAALLLAMSGVVAIIGGSYALRGKNWVMAFAGALGATVGIWPLGLVPLILTVLAREEFEELRS